MTNKEALQIWADALEFEDIKQAQNALMFTDASFCGLGVACKKYAEIRRLDVEGVIYGELDGHMPREVAEWLGITRGTQGEIITMNDHARLTLPQIGAWVRDNLIKDE